LFVPVSAVLQHTELQEGGRGALKVLVSKVYASEEAAVDPVWSPVGPAGKTPVLVLSRPEGVVKEVAYFTQATFEQGHAHPAGLETYEVIKGFMRILVGDGAGGAVIYGLSAGDVLHIMPGTAHHVLSEGLTYLARVTTDHPLEGSQKILVDTTTLYRVARRHESAAYI
jgi:quercetin dioxygenase-like cupin family protein